MRAPKATSRPVTVRVVDVDIRSSRNDETEERGHLAVAGTESSAEVHGATLSGVRVLDATEFGT